MLKLTVNRHQIGEKPRVSSDEHPAHLESLGMTSRHELLLLLLLERKHLGPFHGPVIVPTLDP